jgi:uncharacterized membrane protein (DUF485 family)
MQNHHHVTAAEWDALANDPEFLSLKRARRRFVVPCTILFIALYLALPLGIAFAPGVMNAQLGGGFTVAYAYGLAQFVIAWVLLALYMAAAKRFDARAEEIASRADHEMVQ